MPLHLSVDAGQERRHFQQGAEGHRPSLPFLHLRERMVHSRGKEIAMARPDLRIYLLAGAAGLFLTGCATTLSGRVVNPDGSALTQAEVVVYTSPRSSSARTDKGGAFKLSKNIVPENEYT